MLILVSVLSLLWGCKGESGGDPPIAQVGNRTISRSELIARYGLNRDQFGSGDEAMTGWLEEAARKWALDEILIQEAQRRGLDRDKLFLDRMENLRRDILISLLYEKTTASLSVDSSEISQEYNQHQEEYTIGSDQVEMLYILAPTRDLANRARRELQSGSELEEILTLDDQLSGEIVGWVSEKDLHPKIANLAFALVPGGISYPLKHDNGTHIILQCRQRRQAGTILPLKEMEEEIKGRILQRKKFQAEKALKDSLWAAYNPLILLDTDN